MNKDTIEFKKWIKTARVGDEGRFHVKRGAVYNLARNWGKIVRTENLKEDELYVMVVEDKSTPSSISLKDVEQKQVTVTTTTPRIRRIEFTQEGTLVIFTPASGWTGWDLQKHFFAGACESQASLGVCIVETQSLQEMGFSFGA
jgi:hypothetical protein